MMRSAKWVESTISDPPNPRLITLYSGKSWASDFHIVIVEAPTNRIAFLGGGFARSAVSKAAMSRSQRAKSCALAAPFAWLLLAAGADGAKPPRGPAAPCAGAAAPPT